MSVVAATHVRVIDAGNSVRRLERLSPRSFSAASQRLPPLGELSRMPASDLRFDCTSGGDTLPDQWLADASRDWFGWAGWAGDRLMHAQYALA
mmetsp:Transcript_28987/g.88902  ORF Transcript_28987/g.88902 Transcript_28987/m.88902 type:complete len:93 (-) Transcript_28987:51-329(-)|eukprot:scaffold277055_cov27-Tisochrysis_lutea.AAC.1